MRILMALSLLLSGCSHSYDEWMTKQDCEDMCNSIKRDIDTYFGAPERAICVCSPNKFHGKEL